MRKQIAGAVLFAATALAALPGAVEDKAANASAQYSGWQHSGSIYLLTPPEGANLRATASEDGFPLLVKLDKDFFDFS